MNEQNSKQQLDKLPRNKQGNFVLDDSRLRHPTFDKAAREKRARERKQEKKKTDH